MMLCHVVWVLWIAEKDELIERKNSFRRLADSLKRELMRAGGGGRGDIKLVEENKRIKEELQRRSKSLQDALMALGMAQDSPARPYATKFTGVLPCPICCLPAYYLPASAAIISTHSVIVYFYLITPL
jgi:hypothetical protein